MLTTQFLSSFFILSTSTLVAFSISPMTSVVFLISTFVLTTIILFFFSVDFLSLVFVIVYVGAIAVLFLFVVMMVAIKHKEENLLAFYVLLKMLERIYAVFFGFVGCIILCENIFSHENFYLYNTVSFLYFDCLDNIVIFGQSLYNNFTISFLSGGLVLLVALLGSVLLTHEFKNFKKYLLKVLPKNNPVLVYFLDLGSLTQNLSKKYLLKALPKNNPILVYFLDLGSLTQEFKKSLLNFQMPMQKNPILLYFLDLGGDWVSKLEIWLLAMSFIKVFFEYCLARSKRSKAQKEERFKLELKIIFIFIFFCFVVYLGHF